MSLAASARERARSIARLLAGTLALGACTSPTLEIESIPPMARLLVDGEPVGFGKTVIRQPYFGTIRVDAVPTDQLDGYSSARKFVEANEPVTPWIFPLDLFVEIATYPLREQQTRVRLELPARAILPAGQEAPGMDALRKQAAAAARAR